MSNESKDRNSADKADKHLEKDYTSLSYSNKMM